MNRFRTRTAVTVLCAVAAAHASASAQERARAQPELRLDVIDLRSPQDGTVQVGAGAALPLGYYARLGIIGAGGVTSRGEGVTGSARADVLMRFLIDPFRETRYGVSVGGGLSVRYAPGDGWREYLALVVDVEHPPVRTLVPAIQVGLGGGIRIGIGLRRAQQGRR
jgi:hypothetical protein